MSGKRHTKKRAGKKAPMRQRGEPPATLPDTLDSLLASRYHGAANVSGVRFQVGYSVLRCAEIAAAQRLEGAAGTTLRFEGLEDLDALADPHHPGLCVHAVDELTQVKSSAAGWSWSGLAGPVASFLESFRVNPELQFRLVINFAPRGELAELVGFGDRNSKQRAIAAARFHSLLQTQGGTHAEADGLLERMVLEPIVKDELRRRTQLALADACDEADRGALNALEAILAGHVLDWAAARITVGAPEVLRTLREAVEGIQHAERYKAVERRWVGKVEYAPDAAPEDFLAGKRARIGHVVDGLDIRRPRWLAQITKAFAAVPVCVIRAPSGQGKSTLAFRYAVENWPPDQTVIVRNAGTREEVTAASDYIRFRLNLGEPVRVMVDADFDTRRWPEVAQAAAAAGAQVLATVRAEDWQRFDLGALTQRELVEPTLAADEAREVFSALKARGRVHPSVRSAQEAFERLGQPKLLLEFVHLITQGRMLEDLLRDQVRAFAALNEDPGKTRLLRIASLANALGAPLPVTSVLRAVSLRGDPQVVIGTLLGEYLALEDGRLISLHWVRSDHLVRILHEGGGPPLIDTVAAALDLIPPEGLPFFVTNAFRRGDLDQDAFFALLVERFAGAEPANLLAVVDGLFVAGERNFYAGNRAAFEEAHAIAGPNGVLLLVMDAAPLLSIGLLRRSAELARDHPGAAVHRLLPLQGRLQRIPRGLDWVRRFLEASAPRLRPGAGGSETGKLLDWCALTSVRLPAWEEAWSRLIAETADLGRGLEGVCDFAQGLFRYDRPGYDTWYEKVQGDLLPFLQLELECVTLEILPLARDQAQSTDREWTARAQVDAKEHGDATAEVAITYLVDPESAVRLNDQSMQRLSALRRALPFAGRFHAKGLQFIPAGLEAPGRTPIAVPRCNLPFPSDVGKNKISQRVAQTEFGTDTYYGLQESWHALRSDALRMVEAIGSILNSLLDRKPISPERVARRTSELIRRFRGAGQEAPPLGADALERIAPISNELREVAAKDEPRKWLLHLESFVGSFWSFVEGRAERDGKLAVHNFREAQERLVGLQDFFRVMFRYQVDHFRARELDVRERQAYARLELLLEGWVLEPAEAGPGSVTDRIHARRRAREAELIARLRAALGSLGSAADDVILPTSVLTRGFIRTVAIGVPVADPCDPSSELLAICAALKPVADLSDQFWLFPVKDGAWVGPGAHWVSGRVLSEDVSEPGAIPGALLGLAFPIEPPKEVIALLPPLRRVERQAPGLGQKLTGLAFVLEWYVQQRDTISAIPRDARHAFLVELERRLRGRLQSTEEGIGQLTRETAVELAALGVTSDAVADSARAELVRWVAASEEALASAAIDVDSEARREPGDISKLVLLAALRS